MKQTFIYFLILSGLANNSAVQAMVHKSAEQIEQEQLDYAIALSLEQQEIDKNKRRQKHSNALTDFFAGGRTSLINAVIKGDVSGIANLIAQGTPLNAQDIKGWTALHWAVIVNREDIAKLLLKNGAKSIKDFHGETPLELAFECPFFNRKIFNQ